VQRRKELHRTIGLAIEELYADRLAENYEVLAYHFLRGEEWEKALHYLREAAAKATARSAFPEAAAHLEQAIVALQHRPQSRERDEQAIDLRFALRNSLAPSNDFGRILEMLTEAETRARALGDQRRLGRVFAFFASHAWATVDYQRAIEFGQRALAIAAELGDVPLEVLANQMTAQTYHDRAEYRLAIDLFSRNVTLLSGDLTGERFGLPTLPSVHSRAILAWCYAWQGKFAQARPLAEEVLAIAESHQHPPSLASALMGAGFAYLLRGDLPAAVPLLERAVTMYGSLHFRNPALLSMIGWAYALSARSDEALPLFERSLDLAAAIKFLPCNSIWIVWWGEAYLLQGQLDDAMDRGVRALELARVQKEPAYEAYALHLLGQIAARRDPCGGGAERQYREALAIAERLGLRPLAARCFLGLGALSRQTGNGRSAEEHLTMAITMFRDMGMPLWLGEAQREHAAL
jgi:tetratricopeptide (TPR) repeat protein